MRIDRLHKSILSGLLSLYAGLLFASAPGGSGQGHTYGIIIGVADYSRLEKLSFADKDALEFYLYLQKVAPADANRIFIFLNKKACRGEIDAKFRQIAGAAEAGDRVYIYFSGHGDIEQLYQTNNFLLLLGNCPRKNYMAQPDQLLEKKFFDHYIQPMIERKVKIIFICDACHSGSLIGGDSGKKNNSRAILSSWGNEVKLLSCGPDQAAQEGAKWGGGRGVFSYYLVLGMKGLADKDGNRQVSLSELQEYLDGNVEQQTKAFDLVQQPAIVGEKGFVVSNTSPILLIQAKQQLRSNGSSEEYNKLAVNKGTRVQVGDNVYIFKSSETGRVDLEPAVNLSIKDNYWRTVYYAFRSKVEEGRLLSPGNGSAYYYYRSFTDANKNAPETEEMKISLLTALTDTYDSLLMPFYREDTTGFAQALQAYDEKTLSVALDLAGDLPSLNSRIKAGQLFLQACKANGDTAVDLIKEAINADSTCPALYCKLGDLYFADQQFKLAADSYTIYVQMLPNEEHAHNKLGRALQALGQNDRAGEEFKTAARLNF